MQQEEIEVLYRDDRLIAVMKPSGMIVHRGWDNDAVTAADLVRDVIIGKRVHALYRLDRGTSGVLLFGLDPEIAGYFQSQAEAGRVRKEYLALVRGPMLEGTTLDHAIPQRNGGNRVDAVTEFEPVAHKDRWSLVRARPLTGRLHQIRRHLKHLSHPIVGDVRYGKGEINRFFRDTYDLNRLALHARSISFARPDGEAIEISASMPADLEEPLARLGMEYHRF
ncbi:MAG: RluA family pseudouridine synthase [Candidatus Obscuribacterales bacterium]